MRLIARMNFSLKNYSCELFNLTETVGEAELTSTFTTVVCESWNVTNTLGIILEIITWSPRKHVLANMFLNSPDMAWFRILCCCNHHQSTIDLSEEILAIDELTALKSSLKHRRKHFLRLLRLYGDQAVNNYP